MLRLKQSLSAKIIGILLVFFLVALAAIGITLFISWQLEGAAAAINDAGSLRMRAYRMAHHVARADGDMAKRTAFAATLKADVDEFERVLGGLALGDPARPLFIPRDGGIPTDVAQLGEVWNTRIRPVLADLIADPNPLRLHARLPEFDRTVSEFVAGTDDVVRKMEQSYARNTNILRASQVVLIALAIIGTVVLTRFFFVTVIRPVCELQDGMKRMEQEDFNARVPMLANDEFGELSEGFNRMAAHLQSLYATLEERVAAKTRSLEVKNRDLEIIHEVSAFLREPNDVDSLCHGFLQRMQGTLGAHASSARLLDVGSQNLCLTVHEGLDESFVESEAVLACGECVCGEAAQRNISVLCEFDAPSAVMTRESCRRAGFRAVSATAITANKRVLGVFNLYFSEARPLGETERQMLETLGQQLGIAIENQRLQARDRELAVSEERNLLARELHDSIAQGLAFLNLQAQLLEQALAGGRQRRGARHPGDDPPGRAGELRRRARVAGAFPHPGRTAGPRRGDHRDAAPPRRADRHCDRSRRAGRRRPARPRGADPGPVHRPGSTLECAQTRQCPGGDGMREARYGGALGDGTRRRCRFRRAQRRAFRTGSPHRAADHA